MSVQLFVCSAADQGDFECKKYYVKAVRADEQTDREVDGQADGRSDGGVDREICSQIDNVV